MVQSPCVEFGLFVMGGYFTCIVKPERKQKTNTNPQKIRVETKFSDKPLQLCMLHKVFEFLQRYLPYSIPLPMNLDTGCMYIYCIYIYIHIHTYIHIVYKFILGIHDLCLLTLKALASEINPSSCPKRFFFTRLCRLRATVKREV